MSSLGPIYVVTDTHSPHELRDQVMFAAQGGADLIQLRDKRADDKTLFLQAKALLKDLRGYACQLVINDRIEVALALPGCGLHLGQSDGELRVARDRLGPDRILGLSIEHAAQLEHTDQSLIDYIGAGPVRATATKPDHAPPLGFEGLAKVINGAERPVYAIGGLSLADIEQLKSVQAFGIAVVSAVTQAPDPCAAVRALGDRWRDEATQF